jgi:putative phosphotransacetylase
MSQVNRQSLSVDRGTIETMVRETLQRYLPARADDDSRSASTVVPRLVANISARHVHLSRQALDTLFGQGVELTIQKELYQQGAFAAEQAVTVFGPRQQMIANVRILGPLRDYNQVELSFSDARFLGIDAPVRLSGDHTDTPGCYLVGPAGGLELKTGVIRAARHVHMSPAEAAFYGVQGGDLMRLVVDSEQGGALSGLICRVSEREKLEVHLDTDEGNAIDLVRARKVHLEKETAAG